MLGRAAGLAAVGVAPADAFTGTRAILEARRAAGLAGSMAFTYKNPARSTDPSATVPGARALVVGALAYGGEAPPAPDGVPAGRVARYAWGDIYGRLRAGLDAMAVPLRAAGWKAVVLADQNHLVDREAAYRAGIGWYGKNSNLLLPGLGSWFVLGAVVTTAPLPTAAGPVPDGCGPCRRCLDGCPTDAIVAPGVVDARRCLAWLVQAPGIFPFEHRIALGDRIYGCDDCQEVCPPNRRNADVPAPLGRSADVPVAFGRAAESEVQAWVSLFDLLDLHDDALIARHGRWYLHERDPRWWRRNALLALGNSADPADPRVAERIGRYLAHPDPMLRAHAVWAARRLGLLAMLAGLSGETDPDVRAELAAAVQPREAR